MQSYENDEIYNVMKTIQLPNLGCCFPSSFPPSFFFHFFLFFHLLPVDLGKPTPLVGLTQSLLAPYSNGVFYVQNPYILISWNRCVTSITRNNSSMISYGANKNNLYFSSSAVKQRLCLCQVSLSPSNNPSNEAE